MKKATATSKTRVQSGINPRTGTQTSEMWLVPVKTAVQRRIVFCLRQDERIDKMAVARVTPTGEKAPRLQRPCVSECVLLRRVVDESVSSGGPRV